MTAMNEMATLCMADGKDMGQCDRVVTVPLQFPNNFFERIECMVVPIMYDIILGNSWLEEHLAAILVTERVLRVTFNGTQDLIYSNAASALPIANDSTSQRLTSRCVSMAALSVATFAKELRTCKDIESIGWIMPNTDEIAESSAIDEAR
ncbi:hypothetical protein GGI13_002219, partial [Coemansia sp. RSA 455]